MTNQRVKWIIFWLSLPALLAGITIYSFGLSPKFFFQKPEVESATSYTGPAHPLIYYEERVFWEGVAETDKKNLSLPGGTLGGVLPHHLFPGFILSDFFKRFQKHPPRTIILIGPNHKEKGIYKILTSLQGWQTPFGVVAPNQSVIQKLTDSHLAVVNEPVVEDEHSVAGMMSYIKYYLPNAAVVPLVLRSTLNLEDTDNLAKLLAPFVNEQTIVIAPVDFSHYLTSEQATANDKITWQAIQEFDYKKILSLSNDYVDGPTSIVSFLKMMQLVRKTRIEKLYNTNSGILENNPFEKTTSYFSLLFY